MPHISGTDIALGITIALGVAALITQLHTFVSGTIEMVRHVVEKRHDKRVLSYIQRRGSDLTPLAQIATDLGRDRRQIEASLCRLSDDGFVHCYGSEATGGNWGLPPRDLV